MEEWVGRQWHRFITRAADGRASQAPVRLEEMQRTIGLMFRAGGGGQGVRIAPAGTSRVGGARSLLPLAMMSASPAVDHEVTTGSLNFHESNKAHKPMPVPSAQNQELICAVLAPRFCAA